MIPVIVLYALFASLFGLSKATLEHSEPLFLIGSRMAFAGILLLIHQCIFNRSIFKDLDWRAWRDFAILGLSGIYAANIFEIWGLMHMSSAKACFIFSVSPFISGLFSYFVFREILTEKKWLGMLIGFMGFIPLQLHSYFEHQGDAAGVSLGELALLVGVVASVHGWIVLKKIVMQNGKRLLVANGASMLFGGSLALVHSYIANENWSPVPVTNFDYFLMNTLAMCLISNVICYNLYGSLLKRYSATFMSFAGLITPLFASLFGWYFLDEHMSWYFAISFVLFVIGLKLFHAEELRRRELSV
jgi:drug/metabolite transporter (DMT)-like permease